MITDKALPVQWWDPNKGSFYLDEKYKQRQLINFYLWIKYEKSII